MRQAYIIRTSAIILSLVLVIFLISSATAADVQQTSFEQKIIKKTSGSQIESDYIDVIITFNEQVVVEKTGIMAMSDSAKTIKSLPIKIKSNLPIINAVSATIHKDELEGLQNNPSIARIEMNEKRYIMLDDSVPLINAGSVLTGAGYDLNGSGVKVCILDTGYDFFHENLPAPAASADFTESDTQISRYLSTLDTEGQLFNYTLNVSNASITTITFNLNWWDEDNRFDLYVYYPNGTLANSTEGLIPENETYNHTQCTDYTQYKYIEFNVSIPVIGEYTLMLNQTNITSSLLCTNITNHYELSEFWWTPEFPNIHPQDDDGHGTHVAGIIAGNDTNYTGVSPNVELYIAKVIDSYGEGTLSELLEGMRWCINNNVSIMSMSLGGYASKGCNDSDALLVDKATLDNDILSVIAAGNSGPSTTTIATPGCARTALTVGATEYDGRHIWSYSSRGFTNDTYPRVKPEIVAPGEYIMSSYITNTFLSLTGTSMATPHVAGAAALILQNNPTLTVGELKVMLMNSANNSKVSECSTITLDNICGAGFLDVLEAVNNTRVLSANITNNTIQYYSLSGSPTTAKATTYWEEFYNASNVTVHHSMNLTLQRWNGTTWVNVDNSIDTNWVTHQVGATNSSSKWRVLVGGKNVTGNKTFYMATSAFAYPTTTLTLNAPVNNTKQNTTSINFNYTINSTNLSHCMLWIANASNISTWHANLTNNTPTNNATNNFTQTFADGNYIWNIECNGTYLDTAFSDFNETNRTFTIDSTAPIVTINNPVQDANISGLFLLNWTIDDLTFNRAWYLLDNNTTKVFLTGSSNTTTLNITTQGNHTITLFANDSFNNTGNASVNFTIDSIAPELTLIEPTNETTAIGNTTNLNYTVSDNVTAVDSVWYSLDGAPDVFVANTPTNTTIDLTYPGKHVLEIFANDSANNTISANVTFYSTASMNMSNWTSYADAFWNTNATILSVWNGTELKENDTVNINDIFNLSLNTTNFNITLENFNGSIANWNYIFDVSESNTDMETEIEMGSGANVTKMIVLSDVSEFLDSEEYNATIRFSPNSTGLDIYYCSTDSPDFAYCTNIHNCTTTFNGTACFQDFTGYTEVYVPHMSAVAVTNNTAPPVITINSPLNDTYTGSNATAIYNMVANITFPEDVVYCNYTLNRTTTPNSSSSIITEGTRTKEWDIGRIKNGVYNITFWCNDSLGYGSEFTSRIFKINDTTAPTISNIDENETSRSAEITWETNEPTNYSIALYSREADCEDKDDEIESDDSSTSFSTEHAEEFSSLAASREYYYQIIAWDYQGNKKEGDCESFTTQMVETEDAIGGSNPGSTPSNTTGVLTENHFVELINPNAQVCFDISSTAIPTDIICVTTSSTVQNAGLTVKALGSTAPRGYPNAPNNAYNYLDITSTFTDSISLVRITFKIPASWFTSNNFDPANVSFYYYNSTSQKWQLERLTHEGLSGTNHIYKTEITHLSKFALSTTDAPPYVESCGNGICNQSASENCDNCPEDCGECLVGLNINETCGNGICDVNEDCSNCGEDCGECTILTETSTGGFSFEKFKQGLSENKFVIITAVIISLVVVLVYVVFVMEPKNNGDGRTTLFKKKENPKETKKELKKDREVSEPKKPFFKKPEIKLPEIRMPSLKKVKDKIKKKKGDFELEPGLFKLR